MIVALAGGVGAAKLLRGLVDVIAPETLTIISNTGDDIELYGLHISPDIDIVAYTLKLDQKIKEDLLAQPLPDLRALLLLECLGARGRPLSLAKFPPEFSLN